MVRVKAVPVKRTGHRFEQHDDDDEENEELQRQDLQPRHRADLHVVNENEEEDDEDEEEDIGILDSDEESDDSYDVIPIRGRQRLLRQRAAKENKPVAASSSQHGCWSVEPNDLVAQRTFVLCTKDHTSQWMPFAELLVPLKLTSLNQQALNAIADDVGFYCQGSHLVIESSDGPSFEAAFSCRASMSANILSALKNDILQKRVLSFSVKGYDEQGIQLTASLRISNQYTTLSSTVLQWLLSLLPPSFVLRTGILGTTILPDWLLSILPGLPAKDFAQDVTTFKNLASKQVSAVVAKRSERQLQGVMEHYKWLHTLVGENDVSMHTQTTSSTQSDALKWLQPVQQDLNVNQFLIRSSAQASVQSAAYSNQELHQVWIDRTLLMNEQPPNQYPFIYTPIQLMKLGLQHLLSPLPTIYIIGRASIESAWVDYGVTRVSIAGCVVVVSSIRWG